MTNKIDPEMLSAVCGGIIVDMLERKPTPGQNAAYEACNTGVDNKSAFKPWTWGRSYGKCLGNYIKAIESNPPTLVKRELKF
jgi:hypothetical protein